MISIGMGDNISFTSGASTMSLTRSRSGMTMNINKNLHTISPSTIENPIKKYFVLMGFYFLQILISLSLIFGHTIRKGVAKINPVPITSTNSDKFSALFRHLIEVLIFDHVIKIVNHPIIGDITQGSCIRIRWFYYYRAIFFMGEYSLILEVHPFLW
jgi:hypothetical protein